MHIEKFVEVDHHSKDCSKFIEKFESLLDAAGLSLSTGIECERLSGAMTNCIYRISDSSHSYIIKVYGKGTEEVISRLNELKVIRELGILGLAPKLLATFSNGRIEQYIPSVALTSENIRDRAFYVQIAAKVAELHSQKIDLVAPDMWSTFYKWYFDCKTIKNKGLETIGFYRKEFFNEMERYESLLRETSSPIVVLHNDLQYGNIVQKPNGHLMLLDFEYTCLGNAAYDLANFFCEWTADYSSGFCFDESRFPTDNQQEIFIEAYLKHSKGSYTSQDVQIWKREVLLFVGCSHLFWGLWGLLQSRNSGIDFDYMEYGIERLRAFKSFMNKY